MFLQLVTPDWSDYFREESSYCNYRNLLLVFDYFKKSPSTDTVVAFCEVNQDKRYQSRRGHKALFIPRGPSNRVRPFRRIVGALFNQPNW